MVWTQQCPGRLWWQILWWYRSGTTITQTGTAQWDAMNYTHNNKLIHRTEKGDTRIVVYIELNSAPYADDDCHTV